MTPIRIPLIGITMLAGLALIGSGVDGSTGAGIALVASMGTWFLGGLMKVMLDDRAIGPPRRTLRHRWFLAIDQRGRRRSVKRNDRARRKEAERDYLRRRAEVRERDRRSHR